MTGRVIVAHEALARGVVSRVGTLDDALALATTIASAPRPAVREVKRRVLLEAQTTWMPLLEDEERALRSRCRAAHVLPPVAGERALTRSCGHRSGRRTVLRAPPGR
jgi:enoyl-CoA hydratase/carnithine racemase